MRAAHMNGFCTSVVSSVGHAAAGPAHPDRPPGKRSGRPIRPRPCPGRWLAGVALVIASGCGHGDWARAPLSASRDTAAAATLAAPETVWAPRYSIVPVEGPKGLRRLQKELGPERFAVVLKVNRIDLAHVRDRDSLIVPDSVASFLALSPFPRELSSQRARHKLLLVSLRVQAFGVYDSGALARWGPTSTGRESVPTPEGLYHTNWKEKQRVSTFNDEWLLKWYVNLENFLGISLHEYDLPGYPASHSCVRLHADDAQWLYGWAETWRLDTDGRHILQHGTPVVVFGRYTYHRRPPWKRLAVDSTATDISLAEIEEALRAYLPPDTAAIAQVEPPP